MSKPQTLLTTQHHWEFASASRFLYASAVTVLTFAVALAAEPRFASWFFGLDGYRPFLVFSFLVLLSFPIGYTINALSYFIIGPPKMGLERFLFRYRRIFLPRLACTFDLKTLLSVLKIEESWPELVRRERCIDGFRQITLAGGADWRRRSALSNFVRNVSLVAVIASFYFLADSDWKRAAIATACLVVTCALAAAIDLYVRLEQLQAVLHLDRVIFFPSPIETPGDYSGEDLLQAMLHRLYNHFRGHHDTW